MSLRVLHVAVKADQHRRCAPLGRRMNEVPPVRLSRNGLGRRRFAHGPSYRLFRRPFVRLVSALPLMRFRRAGSACWPLLARFVNPLFPAILEITLPRCGDVCPEDARLAFQVHCQARLWPRSLGFRREGVIAGR